MSDASLPILAAVAALIGLACYAIFAGADFGGGVWDLFSAGPRRQEQRDAIAHAMGPVWEANHVWLIFLLVVLFTCFPHGYAALCVAMFVPFHLALLGIMLRGAAFVFRAHSPKSSGDKFAINHVSIWSAVFGAASIITPLVLGAAFGAVTAGEASGAPAWLRPYSLGCAALALSACAYLAAVYLTVETKGDLREDFRRRAIFAGTATAALAGVVLFLARWQARWFFDRLFSIQSLPVVALGLCFFIASAWAVFQRRYRLSRFFAAGEIVLLLLGWGLAQNPYLIYPGFTLQQAAAPAATIRFLLLSLPVGALFLGPSLWLLFRVFKKPNV